MNTFPSELAHFLAFFRLSPVPETPNRFLDSITRVHALIHVAMHSGQCTLFDEQFAGGSHFVSAYFRALTPSGHTKVDQTGLLDLLQSTFTTPYEFITDSSSAILRLGGTDYNLFPFVLNRNGSVYWFVRPASGSLIYQDAAGRPHSLDFPTSSFSDAIDAFFEKGWCRVVVRALAKLPELKQKNLENRLFSAHNFLACELYRAGRYSEASAEFVKALKLRPNATQTCYNLTLCHARLKQYKEGIQLLAKLNRMKPKQAKTFELLADFYLHSGDAARAASIYRQAMELTIEKGVLLSKVRKAEEQIGKSRQEIKKEEEKEEKFSLQNYVLDLTLEAELGRFPAVFGRESELQQMQEILSCQSKKNLLVLGDPGVGKTALVQEFAYRIASGQVGSRLKDKRLLRVNMGAMVAGAKFRGQFEERLMQLIREVKKSNTILFIDDLHQVVSGGGGKSVPMEAAHFLKPALMNDEIQMIGATSYEEFRNSIEKDSSFLRCFQMIRLEEPEKETLSTILQAYRTSLEEYHQVQINEESIETALLWVKVLLRDRALPDKALDVMDRAAARVSAREENRVLTSEDVLWTLSEMTSIPLSRMSISETAHYRNIEDFLGRRVVGQYPAVTTVSRVLCTSKLRMNLNPVRPKGIFLFVGPTGVGKTELARAMSEFLFGDEHKIVRIDMSEYMERYSASRLVGTSPGYVGYYDQNQLVDKIRNNPYSLILLDEIEKADSQLLNIFLQVFDAGRLTDGKGKVAYFDNTTIVMTSNIGTYLFAQNRLGYGSDYTEAHVTRSDLLKEVKRFFQPEFLNRIDEIVFFKPLSLADVKQIANIKLASIFEQLRRQNKELKISDRAMEKICKTGYDQEYGARNLERVIRRCLLDKLAELALREEWPEISTISADWQDDEIILKAHGASGLQEILQSPMEQQDFLEK